MEPVKDVEPCDTELICVDCATILTSQYPCVILTDGRNTSKTFHLCQSCFRNAYNEFASAYRCALISKEAGEREGMDH